MGLEGISVNQLRVAEQANVLPAKTISSEVRIVDGLSQGQRVDPDKEDEEQNQEFEGEFSQENEQNIQEEEIVKYDLSNSSKYSLNLEEETNNVLIIENSTNKVVQKISADNLSKFVNFLSNSQGSIINRKL